MSHLTAARPNRVIASGARDLNAHRASSKSLDRKFAEMLFEDVYVSLDPEYTYDAVLRHGPQGDSALSPSRVRLTEPPPTRLWLVLGPGPERLNEGAKLC